MSDYQHPIIKIKTSKGDITCELYEDKVPNAVANIITLADSGYYSEMFFHRLIPGFMAQGGCPNSKPGENHSRAGYGDPGYSIPDEFHPELKHDAPGVLSMANSGANTSGSQFFLTFCPTPHLDSGQYGRYIVFGKMTEGLDVLKSIEECGSRSGAPSEKIDFSIEVVSKNDKEYVVEKN